MKRRHILLLALLIPVVFSALPAAAAGPIIANGGGRGTVDGVNAFSYFGFEVSVRDGIVSGQFNCLMAGASAFPGFEPLMKVSGAISSGTVDAAAGTAEFVGSGTLNLGPSGQTEATFMVRVSEGGAGVGKLHLTVLDPPLPVPEETVLSGDITIH
jgi:hypothetical protein